MTLFFFLAESRITESGFLLLLSISLSVNVLVFLKTKKKRLKITFFLVFGFSFLLRVGNSDKNLNQSDFRKNFKTRVTCEIYFEN